MNVSHTLPYNSSVNIIVSPQAFKGSLGGMEAARAIAEGIHRAAADVETVLLPVADGGDGTLEALVGSPAAGSGQGPKGRYFEAQVTGPLGERVERAAWGVMGLQHTAVIEMAKASGLVLVPSERRDPRIATTYGTGELIRAALDAGYRDIIVGLGGSATNDGGTGMAQALGARFLDAAGKTLPPGGAALARLESIDLQGLDTRLKIARLRGATDVLNPLCGPQGATYIYGPQKGATPEMLKQLDTALEHYALVLHRELGIDVSKAPGGEAASDTGDVVGRQPAIDVSKIPAASAPNVAEDVVRRQPTIDVSKIPGAGAGGGTGAGLVALLGGELVSGAELVCNAMGLNHYLAEADLVFIGEGQMDGQTIFDKAPFVVTRRARSWGVPVIAIAGTFGPGYEGVLEYGIEAVEVAAPSEMLLEEAMANAYDLVRDAAERAMREYVANSGAER